MEINTHTCKSHSVVKIPIFDALFFGAVVYEIYLVQLDILVQKRFNQHKLLFHFI